MFLKKFNSRSGFTLIELIMTIVLVGIISVPLSLFVVQTAQSTFKVHDHSIGASLARLEMEKVNNIAYASLATGTTNFSNYQGYPYNVQRTVAYVFGDNAAVESLKSIIVTVTRAVDSTTVLTLRTYRAKNVAYGL